MPGTVTLQVQRLRARRQRLGAIFALAGGPGQAALPFLADFADEMRAGLGTRDLIVFDQRGTGRSGLLRCPPLERTTDVDPAAEIRRCAESLGPRRSHYTTSDSVEDMEAVRRAANVERITIYGSSYGTKVALAYAARYPSHVERLVLDSVVALDGPDFFMRESFRATPRALRALCARRACSGITRDPVTDLAALVSRLARAPARGRLVGGDGRARVRQLGRLRLLRILSDGDFEPTLRAELPAVGALRSSRRQRADPEARRQSGKVRQLPGSPAGVQLRALPVDGLRGGAASVADRRVAARSLEPGDRARRIAAAAGVLSLRPSNRACLRHIAGVRALAAGSRRLRRRRHRRRCHRCRRCC